MRPLIFTDVRSLFINGGGGSWQYRRKDNGTLWTQMGTCTLKNGLAGKLLTPFIRLLLRHSTRTAMKLAKKIIEQGYPIIQYY